jgi:hypothetical protein
MRCPRLAWYDEHTDKPKIISGGGQLCGSIAHAFVEIYSAHDANFDPEDVLFVPPEGWEFPADFIVQRAEAERMFAAYKRKFAPNLGGKLIWAEKSFELVHNDVKLTAKLDACYELPERNDLDVPAGTYIVDYKFLGKFGAAEAAAYARSPQAAWYRYIAWFHGENPNGFLFLVGVKTKVPRFEVVKFEGYNSAALAELMDNMTKLSSQQRTYQCSSAWGNCSYMKQCLGE